jgi:mRNA interferase RelE/StbE
MSYKLWIDPPALRQAKESPGHMRQRIRRAIDDLRDDPHPQASRVLRTPNVSVEIRRLKLDRWRIVYGFSETDGWVWVLAIHKRPPYNYDDLPQLLTRLRELRS